MKEGINLAPERQEDEAVNDSGTKSDGKFAGLLKRIDFVLLVLLIFLFFSNLIVSYLGQREQEQEKLLEKKFAELVLKKKAGESLVKRQEDLKFTKTLRIDFKKYLGGVMATVPSDVILNSLYVSSQRVEISAKAKNSSSLSLFVKGLSDLKNFSQIDLIRSSYNEETNDFSFTLICQVIPAKN